MSPFLRAAATAALLVCVASQGQIVDLIIPPAGSLGPVSGRVIGLPNAVAHKACVYLESASATFNGPKPFEDEGSSSPVDAAGRFNYVAWWANAMYDPIARNVFVFIYPNALGDCVATMGGAAIPPSMFVDSVAWAMVPRVNTMVVTAALPPTGQAGPVVAHIAGIPEAAGEYSVSLFARLASGNLVGPLPGCTAAGNTAALSAADGGGFAAAWGADWDGGSAAVQAAPSLLLALYAAAYPIAGMPGQFGAPATCLTGTQPAFDNSFPVLAFFEAARPPVSPTATRSPLPASASASLASSGTATPAATRGAGAATRSASASLLLDVLVARAGNGTNATQSVAASSGALAPTGGAALWAAALTAALLAAAGAVGV